MTPIQYIEAARVPPTIPSLKFGLWTIRRESTPHDHFDTMTILSRICLAGLHLPDGEVVMEDSAQELQRHLPIWIKAYGRVLVTGLGLGCVVRGLLANHAVEHIDVVEIDENICEIIGAEFVDNSRVTLHCDDALSMLWAADHQWDFGWHDLWSEDFDLQFLHAQILAHYHHCCVHQGAWAFPRPCARIAPFQLINAPRRRHRMSKQKGSDGIGSHKHGTSGRATKSPRLRHWLKRYAEQQEHNIPGKTPFYDSMKELMDKEAK